MASMRSGSSESSETLSGPRPRRAAPRPAPRAAPRWWRARCRRCPGRAEHPHQRGRSRRTSGSPPVMRTRGAAPARHLRTISRDLLVAEELVAPQPGQPLLRHAVDAAQVALVGDGDAQVLDAAAEAVAHRTRRGRGSVGRGSAGRFGRMSAARPPRSIRVAAIRLPLRERSPARCALSRRGPAGLRPSGPIACANGTPAGAWGIASGAPEAGVEVAFELANC
jgi:hypothetical protein